MSTTVKAGTISAVLLRKTRQALLIRGILSIILGSIIAFRPLQTVQALVFVIGIFLLITGLATLISGLRSALKPSKYYLLTYGILTVIVAVIIMIQPTVTEMLILLVLAVLVLLSGAGEIMLGIKTPSAPAGKILLIICGIVSLLFGVILLSHPLIGILTVAWLIGTYLIATGIVLTALSFVVKPLIVS